MKKSIAISLLLAVISVYSAIAGGIEWENSLRRGIYRSNAEGLEEIITHQK